MVVYPAIFTEEKEGGYSICFPDLKGCYSCGDNTAHAFEMATEALDGYLASIMDRGIAIPQPSAIGAVKVENENEYVAMICGRPERLLKKAKNKAVKKTLTIPTWLSEMADTKHVNYSSVLQEALKEHLGLI